MRRTFAIILAVIAGLAALIALGFFPQGWLTRYVERELRDALGPGNRVGYLHVWPGRLRAEARDVVILGPGYRLEIPRARVDLALSTLLGRAFALKSLRLENPTLRLEPVPAPATAAASASTAPPPRVTRPVLLGDVEVTGGRIAYHDPALGGDVRVSDLHLTGGVGQGALTLQTGDVRWDRPEPLVFKPIHATVSISSLLAAHLDSLEVATGHSHVQASGALGNLAALAPDLRLTLDVDLRDAARAAGDPTLRGRITGEGRVAGLGEQMQSDVTLDGRTLVAAGRTVERLHVQGAYRTDGLKATFGGAAAGGRFDGSVNTSGVEIVAALRAADLDLASLSGGTALSGHVTLDASARGRNGERLLTSATVQASGRAAGDIAFETRADLTGAITGRDHRLALTWTSTGQAHQAASATGQPSLQETTWNADGAAEGTWPPKIDGRVHGSGTFLSNAGASPFAWDGTVRSQGEDLNANAAVTGSLGRLSLTAARTAREQQLNITGSEIVLARFLRGAAGQVELAYHGAGPPGRFSGTGEARLADLAWQNVRVGAATVDVVTHGEVTEVKAAVPELRLRADARLAPPRPGAALDLAAHLRLDDTPLAPLAPLVTPGRPFEGHARGEISATGPLARLTAARISLRNLALSGPGIDVQLSGTLGLAPDASIDGTLDGRIDLARAPLPLPAGWRIAGATQLALAVDGTRLRPQPRGHVDLHEVTVSQPGLPPLRLEDARVVLSPDALQVPEAAITFANGTVHVSGEAPWGAVWPARGGAKDARADLRWDGIEVAHLQATADEPLTGLVSGEAHVEGSWAPRRLRLDLHMPPLTLAVGDVAVTVSAIDARLREQQLAVAPIHIGTRQGELHVDVAADLAHRTIAASARGAVDLRSLSPLMTGGGLEGRAEVDVRVSGPLAAPRPTGHLAVHDGRLHMHEITTPLTDLTGTIELDGSRLRIASVTGRWGGGNLTLEGGAAFSRDGLTDIAVKAVGKGLGLRYQDIKLRVDADVALTGRTGQLLLAGDVHIARGLYDKDIFLGQSLRTPAAEATDSPFLRTLGLDLRLQTDEPFLVRNNLAQIQARGRLTLRGDAQNPAPFGTFRIAENGRVILQEREFRIDSGTLTYTGSLDPELDIRATSRKPVAWREGSGTSVHPREATVTVVVRGALDRPALELSSEADDLTSVEIASLLATGRTNPGSDRGAWLVGEQAAELIAGPLSRKLSRKLQHLGFDEVTIEPNLIAREENPGARFTFGKNLNPWSSLIYSLGLDAPEDRFIQLNIHPVGDFSLELQRADDDTYTSRLSHVLRIGRTRRRRANSDDPFALEALDIEGVPDDLHAAVVEWIGLKVGQHATLWDIENRADRVQTKLVDTGRIEADVTAAVDGRHVTFRVFPGPLYAVRVTGLDDPPSLEGELKHARYAEEALENGERRLLAAARSRGHLAARVESHIDGAGDHQMLLFEVTPGPRYAGSDVVFDGASAFSSGELLKAAGGPGELATEPMQARRRIENRYRQAYYLTTIVRAPVVTEAEGRLLVHVPIEEGPQARVTELAFDGDGLPVPALEALARPLLEEPPNDLLTNDAVQAIREHYFRRGYPAVRVTTVLIPRLPDLELRFQIQEGPRTIVDAITIEEPAAVSPRVILRELPIHVGDPLDPRKLTLAESRLEKFGLSRVSLRSDEKDPGRILVTTQTRARAIARYSLEYGNGPGTGAAIDAQAPNLLRIGLTPGAAYSYDTNRRDARAWLKLPAFLHRGLFSLTGGLETVKLFPSTLQTPIRGESRENLLLQRTRTIQVLQQVELAGRWQVEYGYEFDRVRIDGTPNPAALTACGPKGGFCVGDVGEIKLSLLRDTRDHLLDARRGRFWSISAAYAPTALGSGATFVKAFGQVSIYRPVFSSAFTWAQAYHVGAGHGFGGQPLFLRERFSAGGAYSLRGFATDSVGPRNALGQVELGDAVVVLNQELRYHHGSGLGAALFYDAGNVYRKASDLDFTLRHAAGVGLRYDSPLGLLRVDWGFPLDRRAGETRSQIFFSLGQAF